MMIHYFYKKLIFCINYTNISWCDIVNPFFFVFFFTANSYKTDNLINIFKNYPIQFINCFLYNVNDISIVIVIIIILIVNYLNVYIFFFVLK